MTPQNNKYAKVAGKKAETPDDKEPLDKLSNENPGKNDITPAELKLLDDAGINESSGDEDEILAESQLDDLDAEGDILNVNTDLTGEDLDVPGSEQDDENEDIGEEDEENNLYSTRDQDDDVDEGL